VTAAELFPELRGQVAIVTGANRGLGRSVARTLTAADVTNVYQTNAVAASVLFLCSSMASVVTGHILHCDGGETI
jgi:NAD(P)-dependent dehydrogenase (short-subunit alcohol dehydrogenase family)